MHTKIKKEIYNTIEIEAVQNIFLIHQLNMAHFKLKSAVFIQQ